MTDLADTIQIENVVASTQIDQELDLKALAMDIEGTDYNPDRFPGLIFRTEDPKAATLIFRSGKIVCTGADSQDKVQKSVDIVLNRFRQVGVDVGSEPPITVVNIVSSGYLGYTLNLNAIAIGLGLEQIEYEPEQFPGLVYRMDEPNVVSLLFGSGKLVITGAKDPSDAEEAIEVIGNDLEAVGLAGET